MKRPDRFARSNRTPRSAGRALRLAASALAITLAIGTSATSATDGAAASDDASSPQDPAGAGAVPGETAGDRIRAILAAAESGADSASLLRSGLRDTDPGVRAAAAQALARAVGTEAIPDLLGALGDSHASVAVAAGKELRAMESGTARDGLSEFLSDPASAPSVRAQLAGTIGDQRDDRFLEALHSMLAHENPSLRRTALQAMRSIGDPAAFRSLMLATQDSNEHIVSEAVQALGLVGDPRAAPRLAQLVKSESKLVRAAVAGALPRVGGIASHPAVLSTLLDDPESAVPVALLNALQDQADESVVPLLAHAVGSTHPRVRRASIAPTRTLDPALAAPLLARLLRDEVETIRAATADAIGTIALASGEPWLIERAEDPSTMVRSAVATALRAFPSDPGLRALAKLAGDEDADVRVSAIEAAGNLTHDAATAILERATADPDHGIRLMAIDALGRRSSETARAALRRAVGDDVVAIRAAAIRHLGRSSEPKDVERIKAALQDPAESVRRAARRALEAHAADDPSD